MVPEYATSVMGREQKHINNKKTKTLMKKLLMLAMALTMSLPLLFTSCSDDDDDDNGGGGSGSSKLKVRRQTSVIFTGTQIPSSHTTARSTISWSSGVSTSMAKRYQARCRCSISASMLTAARVFCLQEHSATTTCLVL